MSPVLICLFSVLFIAHAQITVDTYGSHKGFSVTLPTDCIISKGHQLCLEKPIDYPTDDIDRVARRFQSRSKRHNEEHATTTKFDAKNGCTASRQIIQPFVAVYNHTRHLVIQSEFYKQSIPSVTCNKEGAGCLRGFKFLGTKPSCTTKYTTVNLNVFDSKTSSVTNINVSYPIDCGCEVNDDDSN